LKISVKSFSCRDLNGEEVVIGNGNELPAAGAAKHGSSKGFGNLAPGFCEAFDTIPCTILLSKLEKCGFDG